MSYEINVFHFVLRISRRALKRQTETCRNGASRVPNSAVFRQIDCVGTHANQIPPGFPAAYNDYCRTTFRDGLPATTPRTSTSKRALYVNEHVYECERTLFRLPSTVNKSISYECRVDRLVERGRPSFEFDTEIVYVFKLQN